MAARDRIHHAVKNALIKDGWTITDDPFAIEYEDAELRADLGAERTLAAERGTERIVVEIKSFLGRSWHRDLQQAIGQFEVYSALLALSHPDRLLYLAIGTYAYTEFFERKSVQVVMERTKLKLIVVDTDLEEIKKWIA
jgi:hypothetical protein